MHLGPTFQTMTALVCAGVLVGGEPGDAHSEAVHFNELGVSCFKQARYTIGPCAR